MSILGLAIRLGDRRQKSAKELPGEQSMKFMMMIKNPENLRVLPQELADAIGRISSDPSKATVISSGALAPSAQGSRFRISGGTLTVVDGPFTETKEVVGGFGILEYRSKEEALEGARQYMELYRKFWPGWEGEMEVRQILSPDEYGREAQRVERAV